MSESSGILISEDNVVLILFTENDLDSASWFSQGNGFIGRMDDKTKRVPLSLCMTRLTEGLRSLRRITRTLRFCQTNTLSPHFKKMSGYILRYLAQEALTLELLTEASTEERTFHVWSVEICRSVSLDRVGRILPLKSRGGPWDYTNPLRSCQRIGSSSQRRDTSYCFGGSY